MQTFLPVVNFAQSAAYLDDRRLGKQRVETYQILQVLFGDLGTVRWRNHPAVKMWSGSEIHLAVYGFNICTEWQARGFQDTMYDKIDQLLTDAEVAGRLTAEKCGREPWWLGSEPFHRSHRSNLLRKAPEHYRKFWPDEPDDLPYVWPDPFPE